jgi:hypothetical protein
MKAKKTLIIILCVVGGFIISSCNKSVPCPAYAQTNSDTEIVIPN